MLWTIARFELAKRRRMMSSYVYFVALFAMAYLMMIAAAGAFSSVAISTGPDKMLANAPHQVHAMLDILGLFALMLVAAVFGQAVYQDFESRTDSLFFTLPIDELTYLAGRFLGAWLFALALLSALALGLWSGTLMPFCDRAHIGPNHLSIYLWPYLTTLLPNLFFAGAIFFTLATLSRKIAPVYVGAVILIIGYLIAGSFLRKLENKSLAALVDPFGMRAAHVATEYWTISEQNSLLVPLSKLLVINRLIWISIGVLLLAFTAIKFRFAHGGTADRRATKPDADPALTSDVALPVVRTTPNANPLALLARSTWLAFRETVKSVYFGVIVFAGVLFMVSIAWSGLDALYGTSTYPVTYAVLDITGGTFSIVVLILITLYAGELVFRARDARMDQILDALPTPTWLPFASSLLALLLVQGVLAGVVMLTGIAIQTFKGYFHYELGLYVKELFGLQLIGYALLCVLAIAVQTLVDNKYVGHFVMVIYYASSLFMGKLGLEHNLYKFSNAPSYQYSDMNRFGHFLRPVFYFDAYWAAFAILLAVASNLFWVRGLETHFATRTAIARARFSAPLKLVGALALMTFAGLGGFIYYNTNVVNHYQTEHDSERDQADYEKTYKSLQKVPQPRVTDVNVAFDIFPEQPGIVVRARCQLTNKSAQPIRTIYLNLDADEAQIKTLTIAKRAPSNEDKRLSFFTFDLAAPLEPNQVTTLEYELSFGQRGFRNETQSLAAVENGTFFSSSRLPTIGYQENVELQEDGARKKYGLKEKERMSDVDDLEARRNNAFFPDADFITFEATVSTAPDQIAVAPGYLDREWSENGRRYFHYKMDSPILNFFSVLSARYQVKRDRWNDVALEIYYHPGHEYDLDQMMMGMKKALDYYTKNFGPYQHRQVRILEFPRYASFAQSFPNTIPYSEAIGFIARVDPKNPEDIDFPFYVTAHEVAHQWWAHQVVPGNVQGSSMLSETMSQYSALMVMKHEFGADKMHRFLKYELDKYLRGRTGERKKEQPLSRVENQPYIHYQKGSLVMYALQDYIGEENLNRALAAYVARVKFQPPPYTNTTELLAEIRKVTPPDLAYLIDDLFERITLYDNRAISATSHKREDGKYEVTIKISAKKLQADALGVEREVPMNDFIDVGAVDEKDEPVFREKRRIHAGESEISFVVDKAPAKAGIDPLNELIDRKPDDNLVSVK